MTTAYHRGSSLFSAEVNALLCQNDPFSSMFANLEPPPSSPPSASTIVTSVMMMETTSDSKDIDARENNDWKSLVEPDPHRNAPPMYRRRYEKRQKLGAPVSKTGPKKKLAGAFNRIMSQTAPTRQRNNLKNKKKKKFPSIPQDLPQPKGTITLDKQNIVARSTTPNMCSTTLLKWAFRGSGCKVVFPAISVSLKQPPITNSVYDSGEMGHTGGHDTVDSLLAMNLINYQMWQRFDIPFQPKNFGVVNIATTGYVGYPIRLDEFNVDQAGTDDVQYEPDNFPGLQYYFHKKLVGIFFHGGKFNVVGCKTDEDAVIAKQKISEKLEKYKARKNFVTVFAPLQGCKAADPKSKIKLKSSALKMIGDFIFTAPKTLNQKKNLDLEQFEEK